jgi:KDO2-lipid IV(A) lauroyltransferase
VKYRLKHLAEYGALRAVSAVANRLPYRGALLLGWVVARLGFALARSRVRTAEARIREVFGDRYARREARRIAWASWLNFVFAAVDNLRNVSLTRETVRRCVNFEEAEPLLNALRARTAAGQGAIVACPHMGSWEIAGAGAGLLKLPLFYISGRQRNPLFDPFIRRIRERLNISMVLRGTGEVRTILQWLRQGRILAVLPEVRAPSRGVSVRFLGRDANVFPGMARFAREANVPIYTLIMTRLSWTRHHATIGPPIVPDPAADRDADVQRMTQEVFDRIDAAVRANPGQWFWYNRRWILEPLPPAPPAR